jgi:hypothetical protein
MDPSLAQIRRRSRREANYVSPNNPKWDARMLCCCASVSQAEYRPRDATILGRIPVRLLMSRRARWRRSGSAKHRSAPAPARVCRTPDLPQAGSTVVAMMADRLLRGPPIMRALTPRPSAPTTVTPLLGIEAGTHSGNSKTPSRVQCLWWQAGRPRIWTGASKSRDVPRHSGRGPSAYPPKPDLADGFSSHRGQAALGGGREGVNTIQT